ncbi:ankyrin repeat protein [Aspergillus fumigatus Z5]|nr:ankyrin repeat protein [Aspergillus fumigatus Z5]
MVVAASHLALNDEEIHQLMHAARCGDIVQLRSLLYGVSPDIRDSTGRTAFSWAASYDLTQSPETYNNCNLVLQFLLDRGANPDLADYHGETPLHWAVKGGDYRMVDLLLQKNVESDLPDSRSRTPLSRAAERGYDRVVEVLLTKGKADADYKDARGRTPLSWAAENWHLETATILVNHGASVDIHDREGQLPLWWFISNTIKRTAMEQQYQPGKGDYLQKWLTLLGPKHGVEPMTKARRTFLSWACEKGDQELVKHFLQTAWADPNSIDRYRKTPLIYALEWNHYEIADMLISGVKTGTILKRDIVSLRIMIQESRSRLLKPFLERYKPSLEHEDEYNTIPLMRIALQQADRATVAVLLEHRASIQGLENVDWFGPCSTVKSSADLVFLNDMRTGHGHNAIPLMKMAIEEGDRAAVAALLDQRERMLRIKEQENDDDSDIGQRSREVTAVAVDIAVARNGTKTAQWLIQGELEAHIRNMPKTADETHLMTFTLSIQMNLRMSHTLPGGHNEGNFPSYQNGTFRTIEWAVLEVPPKAIHYFSNLPFGWVPKNDLEFIQLFMQTWREDWMNFCRDARSVLSRLRSHQLTARGKDDLLIDAVAENMQQWTRLQGTLEEQLSQARHFVSQYQRYSETRRFRVRLGLYQRSASFDQLGNEFEADQLDYFCLSPSYIRILIAWLLSKFTNVRIRCPTLGVQTADELQIEMWAERKAELIMKRSRRRRVDKDMYLL